MKKKRASAIPWTPEIDKILLSLRQSGASTDDIVDKLKQHPALKHAALTKEKVWKRLRALQRRGSTDAPNNKHRRSPSKPPDGSITVGLTPHQLGRLVELLLDTP